MLDRDFDCVCHRAGPVALTARAKTLYTSELLKQMRVPSVSVTDMFMRVRQK
jgi:hypothetical protein